MEKGLCEICDPKQWKTISSNMLTENGYPVYGANGVIGYYTSYNHEEPTILITCRGATCGTLNICEPFSYVNGNAMALDNLSEEIDIRYLYYYLSSRGLSDVITGSAQPQIVRQSLAKVKVMYPPLDEQRKIAAILDKVSDLTAKRRHQLDKLDELVKVRFVEMFGDPITNPKHWSLQSLSSICKDIYGGGTPSKSHPEYFAGNIPWVSPKDMKSDVILDSVDHITEEAVQNSSTKMVPKNAVLMVIRSGILKHTLPVAIAAVELTVNQDMKVFVAGEDITSKATPHNAKHAKM